SAVALLALAGGAVALALAVGRKDEATQAAHEAGQRIFAFAPAEVEALTVVAKGDATKLARQGGGWRITAPVAARADGGAVELLVRRVAELRRKGSAQPSADAASRQRQGLATPRARLELVLRGGKKETLSVGDENPFDGSVFVESTSGAVDLVGAEARWGLERGTDELRAREGDAGPAAPAAAAPPAREPVPSQEPK
ncbi:MAG TPA: DUF4340 domain-containing protein, partial [Anaeromyxobacteraceae bacterium]